VSRRLADDELAVPFLGQPDAVVAGHLAIKRYACHHRSGTCGLTSSPPSSATNVFGEHDRKARQMPAFGLRLSLDEAWQI
jgi:hypothetical protein